MSAADTIRSFKLSDSFIDEFRDKQPAWGYNGLGYIVYSRTYARTKPDGTLEAFWETCRRVVEGTYDMQKKHCKSLHLPWDDRKAQRSAQEMYRRMWAFKWLPPGRGLWMMGVPYIDRLGGAALNSCGFVSTKGIAVDFSDPFCWLMDMLMLGVGVGFDTKGAGLVKIQKPVFDHTTTFEVPDTREGWVELLRVYLNAHVGRGAIPAIDYSKIRPAGEPIRGFGGVASGPDPLKELVHSITTVLDSLHGQVITSTAIVDICNLIGRCVVSGNVRRCLPAGTLVHTKGGLVPIQEVTKGQLVQTTKGWAEVTNTFKQGIQEVMTVHTQLGPLCATSNHQVKIFTSPTEFAFKKMCDLKPGDRLVQVADASLSVLPITVLAVDSNTQLADTYDLEVNSAREFVLDSGLVVHNSAEIAFGDPSDDEFLNLKNPEINNEALYNHRWASNNSIFGIVGMDYSKVAELTAKNGEPGYEWLDNAREYGRMGGVRDYSDMRVAGANPCFAGDTLVAVADGRHAVSFEQLAAEGKDVPVYSLTADGKVEIQWGRNPRQTRENAKLVRVHMDDGLYLDVTPDHKMIMRDGTVKEAKNLLVGDSLPIRKKYKDVVIKGKKEYWRVETDLNDNDSRIFEHRLVAKFMEPEKWAQMYDENQQHGWIKGGLVVHHKDYDPLNNAPDNLQIMTFKDHAQYHAAHDHNGENNGMYGRQHTEETKAKIGAKTVERNQDPAFKEKLRALYTQETRDAAAVRLSKQRKQTNKEYWLEQEKTTDLATVWIDEQMFVKKNCQQCSAEFVVPWSKRDRMYCSIACTSVYLSQLESRKNGQRTAFINKQQATLHDQIMIFKDLQSSLRRDPQRKEWQQECKKREVSYRFRSPSSAFNNPHALKSFADLKERSAGYNHRVVKVEELDGEHIVYNITVDKNHTIMICLTRDIEPDKMYLQGVCQCVEQQLEDRELCTLVETFPGLHDSFEDYKKTLKYAYLYAKTVTLLSTHNDRTNTVMMRNRRIGCSMSGIVQAMQKFGRRKFFSDFCDQGYNYLTDLDQIYSDWLCVRPSIKITSVKPSGTVSLLSGVTPGIHFPHSKYYIRRVRLQDTSPLVAKLSDAGYLMEADKYSPNTVVVSFPVEERDFDRSKDDVTMWEQLELAAQMQQYWADNQVSITVTFKPSEAKDIKYALEMYETRLKGVSFLPLKEHGYEQAPYETLSQEQYEALIAPIGLSSTFSIKPFDSDKLVHETTSKYCDGDTCTI